MEEEKERKNIFYFIFILDEGGCGRGRAGWVLVKIGRQMVMTGPG
jgi:hypothetical protein